MQRHGEWISISEIPIHLYQLILGAFVEPLMQRHGEWISISEIPIHLYQLILGAFVEPLMQRHGEWISISEIPINLYQLILSAFVEPLMAKMGRPLLIIGRFLQSHIEESIRFAWLPRDSTDQPVIIECPTTWRKP